MNIQSICICGAGTMGSGIAQVCAASGYQTVLYDVNALIIQKAKDKIEEDLRKLVEKQKVNREQKKVIFEKINLRSLNAF